MRSALERLRNQSARWGWRRVPYYLLVPWLAVAAWGSARAHRVTRASAYLTSPVLMFFWLAVVLSPWASDKSRSNASFVSSPHVSHAPSRHPKPTSTTATVASSTKTTLPVITTTTLTAPAVTTTAVAAASAPPVDTGLATAPPPRPTSIPEGLTFTGALTGTMTVGQNLKSPSHGAPQTSAGFGPGKTTQCFTWKLDDGTSQFEADVLGQVNGKWWSLQLAWGLLGHSPIGQHDIWGSDGASDIDLWTDPSTSWAKADPGGSLTIDPGETSGSVSLVLGAGPGDPRRAVVSGTWRCS